MQNLKKKDLRLIIEKKLRWNFFGPDDTDTEDDIKLFSKLEREDPGKTYITGILSPQLNSSENETDEDESPFSKTGANDSSFGFTFSLPMEFEEKINYGVDFSTYERKKIENKENFIRLPHVKKYSFNFSNIKESDKIENELAPFGENSDSVKLILTRRTDINDNSNILFTYSVVHFGKEESALRPWRKSLFHVKLWVENPDKSFSELPNKTLDLTEDRKQSSLLYRNTHRYAVGHGCGVNWTKNPISVIHSTFFPKVEVPVFKHKELESEAISMLKWAKGDNDYNVLYKIPEEYFGWLEKQDRETINLSPKLKKQFEKNKSEVENTKNRITKGIKCLETNLDVQLAFKWMNHAMLKQQINGSIKKINIVQDDEKFKSGDSIQFETLNAETWPVDDIKRYGKWRLFQLAFILMCIPDMVNNKESGMDLIWFPTGGGKTEAYLGLSAFLLLFERLKGKHNKHVSIIMRYTLRLLTAQQFERAAAMVLAIDDIRFSNTNRLGNIPFTIGLWVGSSVTFNKHGSKRQDYSKNAITSNSWFKNLDYNYYNRPWPWVLQKCPRCSREFGVRKKDNASFVFGIKQDESTNKLFYSCKCSNYDNKSLPIFVVDEDIYSELPSMVIATVDKFARLSWRPESSKILGVNAIARGVHSKLSLIIQDELHLLEGPLGTIVGLYESAIDFLIKRTGANPKRIGSSATLAMAKEQCKSLYGLSPEKVKVFPPPLLNWYDNYFSFVDFKSEGRKYVGIYANGSPSNKTTQYKLFASLLQSGGQLAKNKEERAESFSTLVNYFNSTRDMGQALSLMGDDVPRELRNIAKRFNIPKEEKRKLIDINQGLVQLHGNVKSDTIQKDMGRLSVQNNKKGHVHTVLATNMISVGLDVPRLSLMTILHQPKTMSEYIQASSRIGRGKSPGLVFVILSALRSRDRSHLEDFVMTHNKMYSLVEPSSLTPFSLSAMERALASVLIAIFRNDPEFGLFEHFGPLDDQIVSLVKNFYENRIKVIDNNELSGFIELFDTFCNAWNRNGYRSFGSEFIKSSQDRQLMVPFLTPCSSWSIKPFQILQAMRNVDSGIELKQI